MTRWWSLACVVAVAACSSSRPAGGAPGLFDASTGDASDGASADATSAPTDATPVVLTDAGYAGSDAGVAGSVSCYTQGNPTATCTLPTPCCFTNYTAQHNGYCASDACSWGTITCDGPEDCVAGGRCCARAIKDASDTVVGWSLGCQQTACGASPLAEELCHPTSQSAAGTCSIGTSCVGALGYNNDLPRTLSICR